MNKVDTSPTQTPSLEPAQLDLNPSKRHKKRWPKIVLIILAALLAVTFGLVMWFVLNLTAVSSNTPVSGEIVDIAPNSSIETVANQLSSKQLIGSSLVFVLYTKFGPAKGNLVPGPYNIKPTNNIIQIVGNMSAGKIAINKITFPEGITIADMAKRYQAAGYGSKEDYLQAVKKLAPEYGFVPASAYDNPEGFLYPATYTFRVNSSAEVLVRQQYEAFATNALPILQSGSAPSGLSSYQALIMASIIEREALTVKDRQLTAGVFYNRINKGMKLESDVTVNYGTGKTITSAADVTQFTPYNTYFISSLPPTPINNPSQESLKAAMNPTQSDYIFFLAGNDGVVYYAKTLSEHNENIKKHL